MSESTNILESFQWLLSHSAFVCILQRLVQLLMCGRLRSFAVTEVQEAGVKTRLTTTSAGSRYSTPPVRSPAGPMTPLHPGRLICPTMLLCEKRFFDTFTQFLRHI